MTGTDPNTNRQTRPPEDIARLESLLAQQRQLFERLDELSERQSALIEGDETDRLLDLLAQRQVAVDEIAGINATLEPWRARWAEVVNGLAEPERERIRGHVDAVSALAQRIAERDERDRQHMERRKQEISITLGQVDRGRDAVAAYGGTGVHRSGSGPHFQDREA